jgi:hypothetical protein
MSKAMPDAYSVVFNKEASEDDKDSEELSEFASAKKYTKADIISNFGEEALEALENPDGSINYKKLSVYLDKSPIKDADK